MTFLESAKKVYSDVALLLNKIQRLALDKDPNEPFTDQVGTIGVRMYGHDEGEEFLWLRAMVCKSIINFKESKLLMVFVD